MQKIKLRYAKLCEKSLKMGKKIQSRRDKKHPLPYKELDTLVIEPEKKEKSLTIGQQSIIFRGIGLLFVGLGAILYHTLSYIFMLIFAFITSLALESIIGFRARLTHSRGLGILIAYFLAITFLLSGFFILVPFFLDRGTQLLQSLISFFQTVQGDIITQGFDTYVRNISWLPESI